MHYLQTLALYVGYGALSVISVIALAKSAEVAIEVVGRAYVSCEILIGYMIWKTRCGKDPVPVELLRELVDALDEKFRDTGLNYPRIIAARREAKCFLDMVEREGGSR